MQINFKYREVRYRKEILLLVYLQCPFSVVAVVQSAKDSINLSKQTKNTTTLRPP